MAIRSDLLFLVDELHQSLEDDSSSLSSVLRKAARLAALCGEHEYRLLFEIHLEGIDSTENGGFRIEKWPPDAPSPRWDMVRAVLEDRAYGEKRLGLSALELDRRLHSIAHARGDRGISQSLNAQKALMEAEAPLYTIANRIRNRIGMFVRTIESKAHSAHDHGPAEIIHHGRIFIGHGRSMVWRVLRDFIETRMGLNSDEYNREATAGRSTKERIEEMLNEASFAFLVMTAEDEHADGTRHARENVIHEIGLFQGRLGFSRAIILLEDGCTEFSNLHGLTQIRFPRGDILARSEDVRRVLEREHMFRPEFVS